METIFLFYNGIAVMPPISSTAPHATARSWSNIKETIAPLIAAPIAIMPLFRYLMIKSALQQGLPAPSISLIQGLRVGLKAAPVAGSIVGLQMMAQSLFERKFTTDSSDKTLYSMISSSTCVGVTSAPLLAVFNGYTLGLRLKQSLCQLSFKQVGAIALQETAFVTALIASDRFTFEMGEHFTSFTVGSLGAVIGHPANTALTCWQNGIPITHLTQLMRGMGVRTLTMGAFSLIYSIIKSLLLDSKPIDRAKI